MAWNPSPEVAVARDAAKRLGDAQMCVVLWIDADGEKLGMASFGKTMSLCRGAGVLGNAAYDAVMKLYAEAK